MRFQIKIFLLLLFPIGLLAQTRTISGKVVDGIEPLPGTNVVEMGTTNGTVTDINGKFSLEIPAGKDVILVFSFMGPTIEKKIKKNDSYIRLNLRIRERRLYALAGAALTNSENSTTLSGTTAIGYHYHYYRFGLGGELHLLPTKNSNSTNYQVGIPIYGSIRLINRLKGILGAGYYWSRSNTVNDDFKIQGGLLYRIGSTELDFRYYNGTRSKSTNNTERTRNLNLGVRFYIR